MAPKNQPCLIGFYHYISGGFWVLSDPPVNYEHRWRGWNTTVAEQKSDYENLQNLLTSMCFTLYNKKEDIVVWQKAKDNSCYLKLPKETYPPKCEAFSTYPRTYDLLHLDGFFSAENHRCEMKYVLLEMDRILRLGGHAIIRESTYFVDVVATIGKGMRWMYW
ncbi:hypothetical protein PHAVU_002G130900 [Phaseolus vulgaris]|uniref:Methyltransferase n=1 Tax=Phaseolus vulgaris TaxID=3885 RepID=V7CJ92_PHAVU|nr:hypothetical protein PHAVU_002G130900g [Phaseolus vulgaris]ESW30174.1 hypothetical protein PHAVU_002G130900g [Phaseolus vulgaris]